jgi:hypothetical protein
VITNFLLKKISLFTFAIIYVFSLFLDKITILEIFTNQYLRFSEIIFLIIFFYFLLLWYLKKIIVILDINDKILILIPVIYLSSFFLQKSNIYGFIQYLYLFFIYFVFKQIFINEVKIKNLFKYFIIFSTLTSILVIIGWFFLLLDKKNIFFCCDFYPYYLISKGRATGLFMTPTQLIFYSTIAIIIIFSILPFSKKKIIFIFLNFTGSLLTYSKTLFMYPLLMCILFKQKLFKTFFFKIFSIICIIVLFAHSFFWIVKSNIETYKLNNFTISSEIKINKEKNISLVPTYYWFLTKESISMIKKNIFFGSGFKSFEKNNITKNNKLGNHRVHSLYFETLIEVGLIGFFIIFIIFYKIFFIIRNIISEHKNMHRAIFFFILLEGFFSSLITFKILWIYFAFMFASLHRFNKINKVN